MGKKNKRKLKNKTQVYNSNFLLSSGYTTIKHAKKQPSILLLNIMKQVIKRNVCLGSLLLDIAAIVKVFGNDTTFDKAFDVKKKSWCSTAVPI